MTIRLLVADGHPVVRVGMERLMARSNISLVGQAATCAQSLQLVRRTEADVLLLDVRLPEGGGIRLLGEVRNLRPQLAVLMFAARENPKHLHQASSLNAAGYLLKSESRDGLLNAIQKAAAGETVWTREEIRRTMVALAAPRIEEDVDAPLTQRETQILRHMVRGSTNKQIAQELRISYETVKEHVANVLRKIGVTDRTQAAVWAVREGVG